MNEKKKLLIKVGNSNNKNVNELWITSYPVVDTDVNAIEIDD